VEICATAQAHLERLTAVRREQVRGLDRQLAALAPQATLNRGYALVHHADSGEVVSRRSQVSGGDRLSIQVSDGDFAARVSGDGAAEPTTSGHASG